MPATPGADLYAAADVELPPGRAGAGADRRRHRAAAGIRGSGPPAIGAGRRLGVTVLNAPGTVDAGYRGEILVNLINHDPARDGHDRLGVIGSRSLSCNGWSGQTSTVWTSCPSPRAARAGTAPPAGMRPARRRREGGSGDLLAESRERPASAGISQRRRASGESGDRRRRPDELTARADDAEVPEFGPYDVVAGARRHRSGLDLGACASRPWPGSSPAAGRAAGRDPAGAARPRRQPAAAGRVRRAAHRGHLGRGPRRAPHRAGRRRRQAGRGRRASTAPSCRPGSRDGRGRRRRAPRRHRRAALVRARRLPAARPRSTRTGPGRCARRCAAWWSTGARGQAGARAAAAAAAAEAAAQLAEMVASAAPSRRAGQGDAATTTAAARPSPAPATPTTDGSPPRRPATLTAVRHAARRTAAARTRWRAATRRGRGGRHADGNEGHDRAREHGLLRGLLRRFTASEAELDAEELRAETAKAGCVPAGRSERGQLVTVTGRLRTVVYTPRTNLPTLEADLYDGSDVVTLVWLGRRQIAGIEPGRALTARGRVAIRDDRKVIYNPYYELDDASTLRAAQDGASRDARTRDRPAPSDPPDEEALPTFAEQIAEPARRRGAAWSSRASRCSPSCSSTSSGR